MKRSQMVTIGGFFSAALAVAAIGAAAAHPGHAAEADKPVTITGELIDTACFVAADGEAKGKEHAACAQKCMASGIPAGLLPEGSKDAGGMLFLLTNPRPFAPYAAQTIRVEGVKHEGMRAVDVKKAFAKDGAGWKEIKLEDEHHKMDGGAKEVEKKPDGDGHKGHSH